jgi:BMFP domain-containing protein YqiC
MNSSEKILKLISNFVETGILTSQDAKKELINNLKFKRDDLIDKLQLVSREEFNILKKIIEKQQKQINQLKKNKKTTKAKKF